jgi:hypothetical protein
MIACRFPTADRVILSSPDSSDRTFLRSITLAWLNCLLYTFSTLCIWWLGICILSFSVHLLRAIPAKLPGVALGLFFAPNTPRQQNYYVNASIGRSIHSLEKKTAREIV